jgi:hypothetical protein
MSSVLADYVSEDELAEQFKCCTATIRRYRRAVDGLPHVKIAGKVMFDRRDIAEWMERRKTRPNPTRKTFKRKKPNAKDELST